MNIADDSNFITPNYKRCGRNPSADGSKMVKMIWDLDTVPVPAALKDIHGLRSKITAALNKHDGELQLEPYVSCFGLEKSISQEQAYALVSNGFILKYSPERLSYCGRCKKTIKEKVKIPAIKPKLCEIEITNCVLQHVLFVKSHSSPYPSLSTASSSTIPAQHILIVSGDHHFAKIHQSLRSRDYNSFLAVRADSKRIAEVENASKEERRRIWQWDSLSIGGEALEAASDNENIT